MIHRFVGAEKANHTVTTLCRMLGVSRSGYYASRARPPAGREIRDIELSRAIHRVHEASRGTYGAPRVHAELSYEGLRCSRKRVARLMRQACIQGVPTRRRRSLTRRRPSASPHPDLVGRSFTATRPDRLWVADITYIPTGQGWLYLATVLDCFSRKVVGWAMAPHLRTELVADALEMATSRRRPDPGLVHHSDQGSQYTSLAFTQRLRAAGICGSTGAVGTAYDNACAESFFATLKRELVYRHRFPTRTAARTALFDYIECFYNRRRLHSTLGHLAPEQFEKRETASVA